MNNDVGNSQTQNTPPAFDNVLAAVQQILADEKIDDVQVISLANKSALADYMVVGSGGSSRRLITAAQKLVEQLKPLCRNVPRCEGLEGGEWVLVDAGDVLVHLFKPETRALYAIEDLWRQTGPVLV